MTETQTLTTGQITTALDTHGYPCRVTDQGTVEALVDWTIDGREGQSWDAVPTTYRALLDWLGY